MKQLPRILLAVLLFSSLSAFANSITYTNLDMSLYIGANYGFGDNVFGTLTGRGTNLLVSGGTPDYWFSGDQGYSPGSAGGGSTIIYFDGAYGIVGSVNYGNVNIEAADFNTGSFTFPSNGQKNFTVFLPASVGVITVFGCGSNSCQQYNLVTNPGTLKLSFVYEDGLYYANQGSFSNTPEPSTLGLMAIGLFVVGWRLSRQKAGVSSAAGTLPL